MRGTRHVMQKDASSEYHESDAEQWQREGVQNKVWLCSGISWIHETASWIFAVQNSWRSHCRKGIYFCDTLQFGAQVYYEATSDENSRCQSCSGQGMGEARKETAHEEQPEKLRKTVQTEHNLQIHLQLRPCTCFLDILRVMRDNTDQSRHLCRIQVVWTMTNNFCVGCTLRDGWNEKFATSKKCWIGIQKKTPEISGEKNWMRQTRTWRLSTRSKETLEKLESEKSWIIDAGRQKIVMDEKTRRTWWRR